MLLEVYTDGSATTADLPGGWAFVVCVDGVKVAEGSGSLSKATNNVAEVTAAIRGLEYIATHDIPGADAGGAETGFPRADETDRARVVLISDSQLTLKWATGEFRCKKWHLVPHVIQLKNIYRKLNATTRWVKGHNGDEHNERCDVLAKAAREEESAAQAGARTPRKDAGGPTSQGDGEVV